MREAEAVSKRLAIAIDKSGKTRAEVGSWVGIKSQSVSAWITRSTSIKFIDAVIVARKLGVSLDWLAGIDYGKAESLTTKERAVLEALRAIEQEGAENFLAKLKSESSKPEYAQPLGPAIAIPDRETNH